MLSARPRHAPRHVPRSTSERRSVSIGKSDASSTASPKARRNRSSSALAQPPGASTEQPHRQRACCVPSTSRCRRPREDPLRSGWSSEEPSICTGCDLNSGRPLVRSARPRLAATSRRRPSEPNSARPPLPPPRQRQQPAAPAAPPQPTAPPPPRPQGTSGTVFGVVVVAFVLLCSGAISAYYVWYSHEEFAKHRTTGRQRFSKEQQFSEAELEPQAPLLVAPVTPEEARQPPPATASPTETASTRRREMYFGTPLGHRRALKLRPDEATPELASRRRRCMTRFCQERTDAVLNALNWSVDPCTDFEAFACSRWQAPAPAEVVLAEQLERELYLSLSSKLKPEVWRVEGLLEECLRSPLPQTSRLQLRSLLRDLGLYGWPFRADTQSRGDVWKAAALLFRQLALTPLVGLAIAPHPRNASQPLVALDEPTLLVDAKHALDTAFKHFTPGRYVELAEHVGDFSSRLSQITTGKRAATLSSLRSHGSFGPFLALALGDLVRLQERSPLLLRCERFVRALKALLHATRNRDLLNYLGFRALVHVSPLLTEESRPLATARMFQLTGRRRYGWPRWRRCVLLAERTAPELLSFALARAAQLDRLVGLKLARDLAAAVNESLGNFTWLADADRRNARTLLAALDVQVFYPSWIGNSTLREAYDGLFPEVTRGNVLQTYRDFTRRLTEHRLAAQLGLSSSAGGAGPLGPLDAPLGAPWPWSALDVHAGLDADALRIYVPPALVNGSTRGGDAWLAAQLPAQGPRLAQALIEALHERAHPPARYHWSLNSSVQASQLERCLEPTGGLVMQVSLEPARNLFGRYVTSVQAQGMQDAAFLSPGNLTSERLFYVLFALGSCGRSPAGGGRGNAHINATLRESPQFAEAWDCRPRSAMSPRQRCLPPTAAA